MPRLIATLRPGTLARRIALVLALVASCAAGLTLVWVLAPRSFIGLRTGELLGLFALILLPALTLWGVLTDRAAQRRLRDAHEHAERVAALDAARQRAERRSVIHEPAYSGETSRERV